MSAVRFLTVGQVERLQRKSIELFGGKHGLRDRALFEGAVIHPRNVHLYAGGDLFDVAAAYAFHLAQAQAFLDGNKRVGMASALVFLEQNGITMPIATEDFYRAMIGIAEKWMDRVSLAALFRRVARDSADS